MPKNTFFLLCALLWSAGGFAHDKPIELANVDIESKLGTKISLDTAFTDEYGKQVRLANYFDGKHPVVLFMAYYSCPMLCNLVLGNGRDVFKEMPWKPGEQYRVITVSINPRDSAKAAMEKKHELNVPWDGWNFLVGPEASSKKLAGEIGFKYIYDKETGEYGHAAAMFVLSPDAVLTRVILGMDFSVRDTKLALLEASQGKIGSPAEKFLLFCYHYDPKGNKYSLFAMRLMQVGGILTLLVIAFIYWGIYRRKNAQL